jgi:mevalonate kinase
VSQKLLSLLSLARKINPEFLHGSGFNVTVKANYPLKWGLGSSSSVISLVARWAEIDSWTLYQRYSNGSGYDLACAETDSPIFYRLVDGKQSIQIASPAQAIQKFCYFAFLGNKQDSSEEVSFFLENTKVQATQIERISNLTLDICKDLEYASLFKKVEEHEAILSEILQKPTLKAKRFPDFPGTVKSLGAWGGDFAMFVTDLPRQEVSSVIKNLGIEDTIYTFSELIP